VLGTPFYLMEFVPGRIFVSPGLPDLPSGEHRAAVYAEMARVLGAIHRVEPGAVGLGKFGKPDDYSRRQLERWARQYHASVNGAPEAPVVALIEWLRAHVPEQEPSGRLVHGDFRLDNLVFGSPTGPAGGGTGPVKGAVPAARRGIGDPVPGGAGGGASGGVVAVLDWELSTLGAPYSVGPPDVAIARHAVGCPRTEGSTGLENQKGSNCGG